LHGIPHPIRCIEQYLSQGISLAGMRLDQGDQAKTRHLGDVYRNPSRGKRVP